MAHHGLDGLAINRFRPPHDAKHGGDAGAVDVCIEHTHRGPLGGQGQGQVHRGRGLPHTTLARGDGDHVLDRRNSLETALNGMRLDLLADGDTGIAHTGHRPHCRDGRLSDGIEPALGGKGHHQLKVDILAIHLQGFHQASRHQVLAHF